MTKGNLKTALLLTVWIGSILLSSPAQSKSPKKKHRHVASTVAKTQSKIQHLVILIQENHSFDNYFANYCQAPTGSNPTCTQGPACCEAGPRQEPGSGSEPTILNDAENGDHNPDHTFDCEWAEMNSGKMDQFVRHSCGSKRNFAYADPTIISPYLKWASQYALADRYFQPVVGSSSANDMYFARASFVFKDNDAVPNSYGGKCNEPGAKMVQYGGLTIAHLLNQAKVSWAYYAEGYNVMASAQKKGQCPPIPSECPSGVTTWPCVYDPSDNPFSYYADLRDNPKFIRDYSELEENLKTGTLPAVVFIKAIGYRSEHPGKKVAISSGVAFVEKTVNQILNSSAGSSTLILFTMDEGGGYFDHVSPPGKSAIDGQPYGTRVPTLAIGPFARVNAVSHVTMEHSSVVKFIEWNWLGGKTGQLGQRDTVVNNIGSLLDPAKTGAPVPEK